MRELIDNSLYTVLISIIERKSSESELQHGQKRKKKSLNERNWNENCHSRDVLNPFDFLSSNTIGNFSTEEHFSCSFQCNYYKSAIEIMQKHHKNVFQFCLSDSFKSLWFWYLLTLQKKKTHIQKQKHLFKSIKCKWNYADIFVC